MPSRRTDRGRCALAGACLLGALTLPVAAAEIQRLDVTRSGARYRVDMEVRLAASATLAYAVFSTPALLPKINPAVQKVEALAEPGAPQRYYTEVRVCVAWWCRTLHQVQDLRSSATAKGGDLRADVLPARSDLRFGHAEWQFVGDDRRTDLHAQLEVEPAFWVPPLIGPWLVERMLREQAEITSQGIERLASA
jgi:hypothetical protein